MPWILLVLAAGGGYWWWTSQKKACGAGSWQATTTYMDRNGRKWERVLDSDPPTPTGYSDWIRPGTSTAPVRIVTPASGDAFCAVGKALDDA